MYISKLIPNNFGLIHRILSQVAPGQILHQVRKNISANLFQDVQCVEMVPNAIYIDTTYNCNRRCRGCYVDERSGTISQEVVEAVADYSLRKAVNYIAWLGGEPLLPRVRELVLGETANFPRMSFTFCSNGDYINEELADRIAGLDNLVPVISVDGLEEDHDFRRGSGSFGQALKVFDLFRERRRLFGYMTTIMPHNYLDVSSEAFVGEMVERGCLFGGYSLVLCNTGEVFEGMDASKYRVAISRLQDISKKMPLYVFSSDFGYLGKEKKIEPSKKLIALTITPDGQVKTERGGACVGKIGADGTLDEIVSSQKVQEILRNKVLGISGNDQRIDIVRSIV